MTRTDVDMVHNKNVTHYNRSKPYEQNFWCYPCDVKYSLSVSFDLTKPPYRSQKDTVVCFV